MSSAVFVCPEIKCAYAIDSEGLNKVQLLVLRRTRKTCPGCNTLQQFQEQTTLPNIQTKTTQSYGGTNHEKTTIKTDSAIPKSASQRRRAHGNAGH